MIRNIKVIFLFCMWFPITTLAQNLSEPNQYETKFNGHEVGYAQGAGLGFYYRYIGNDFGVQATVFPLLLGRSYFINTSIHGLAKIAERPKADFLIAVGSNFSFVPGDHAVSPQFGFIFKFKYPDSHFVWDIGLMATAIFNQNEFLVLFPIPSFSLGYRF